MEGYRYIPMDFKDCHPVIKEALRSERNIRCTVWSGTSEFDYQERLIVAYVRGVYVDDQAELWVYAEPIPTRRHCEVYVKRASVIVRWLETHGYRVDPFGAWYHTVPPADIFEVRFFQYCGQKKPEWLNLPEWALELREIHS